MFSVRWQKLNYQKKKDNKTYSGSFASKRYILNPISSSLFFFITLVQLPETTLYMKEWDHSTTFKYHKKDLIIKYVK